MLFNIGDLVTRKSHNNDIIFEILRIEDHTAYLKGKDFRLYADSDLQDLVITNSTKDATDEESITRMKEQVLLDRSEYFYLPGKILHIDADNQLSNEASNPYKIRENTNFKKYKKSQKKQKISNFS